MMDIGESPGHFAGLGVEEAEVLETLENMDQQRACSALHPLAEKSLRFSDARRKRWRRGAEVLWVAGAAIALAGVAAAYTQVPATMNDFFLLGTQPGFEWEGGDLISSLSSARGECLSCHGNYNDEHAPGDLWKSTLMAQAMRDPIFHACLDIANQDVAFAGDLCLRCHTPGGWLEGRSTPTDGSALDFTLIDGEGVSCSICHRMVDPVYTPGQSPADDAMILASLVAGAVPPNPTSANYVIDPLDNRRGPHDLDTDWDPIFGGVGFVFHAYRESPFHQDSRMCATCHDVSNPAYVRQPDGSYALGELDTPHPTQDKYDMFPLERTFSEWEQSAFAQGPIDLMGRFGGNITGVSSCQDCHMPRTTGTGADPILSAPTRPHLAKHEFAGANSWVLRAIDALYPRDETLLTDDNIEASIARNIDMLQRASDLELFLDGSTLTTRVVNYSGHKLPTGYHEGRRIWVNVKYFDGQGVLIAEDGAYDDDEATLDTLSTKVYEAKHDFDANVAALTGKPQGVGFHFALNNLIVKDNRIPPMGFTNAGFESVQAEPVAYTYADGQYWDDTDFSVPSGTARVEARVFYQTTSREYIEFLRDENVNSVGDPMNPSRGEIAYNLWVQFGKSEPVEMDFAELDLTTPCPCDRNNDGVVAIDDYFSYLSEFFSQLGGPGSADFDGDNLVTVSDYFAFLTCFFTTLGPCP